MMIISLASKGMGSVGISLLPVLPTIFLISGNFANNTFSLFSKALIEVLRLLPGKTRVSTAKSPSGKVGINSPPKLDKIKPETIKRKARPTKIVFLKFITFPNDF